MIKGIGVDIIEIERISKAIKNKARFSERFFTEAENDYCNSKADSFVHYAGRFAAKEAVVKAMGTGFKGFKWKDIEIINQPSGKPEVKLLAKAAVIAKEKEIIEIEVSISHSRNYAVAQAIAIGGS